MAAWRGNLDAVKWLLEHGARINAAPRQWSALHYAVFAGHDDVADYLMAQGADINAQSTNGSTVVMMAIYEGREELARKLIEKGADRALKNDWGDGALEWAMRFKPFEYCASDHQCRRISMLRPVSPRKNGVSHAARYVCQRSWRAC